MFDLPKNRERPQSLTIASMFATLRADRGSSISFALRRAGCSCGAPVPDSPAGLRCGPGPVAARCASVGGSGGMACPGSASGRPVLLASVHRVLCRTRARWFRLASASAVTFRMPGSGSAAARSAGTARKIRGRTIGRNMAGPPAPSRPGSATGNGTAAAPTSERQNSSSSRPMMGFFLRSMNFAHRWCSRRLPSSPRARADAGARSQRSRMVLPTT